MPWKKEYKENRRKKKENQQIWIDLNQSIGFKGPENFDDLEIKKCNVENWKEMIQPWI